MNAVRMQSWDAGSGRLLTGAITVRRKLIRIISVRDMSRLERRRYVQAQ